MRRPTTTFGTLTATAAQFGPFAPFASNIYAP